MHSIECDPSSDVVVYRSNVTWVLITQRDQQWSLFFSNAVLEHCIAVSGCCEWRGPA